MKLLKRGVFSAFLFVNVSTFAGEFSLAEKSLKQTFENYKADSFLIPIKQYLFLSVLKTNLSSEGKLFLKGERFRLELKGNPSSLSLFDGRFFWHQADLKEKLVFQLEKPSEIQKISSFFDFQTLLELFEMTGFSSRKSFKTYTFKPKKKIQGLKELVIKTDQNFLSEMRFIWEDLNTWQKYTLSKPLIKNIPDSFFVWTHKDYRILRREDL